MQLARQPQIEIRKVDQDGCVGLAFRGFRHQMLEAPTNVRQVLYHLNQSHDSYFIGMDQQLGSGGTHLFSAHAKEGRGGRRVRAELQ